MESVSVLSLTENTQSNPSSADEIAIAMKSCFAGLYLDGFDFIQGPALGFHLSKAKISSLLATISFNQQKKREHFGYKTDLFSLSVV